MALEELPHDRGGVDFLPRPAVPEAVDANHADLGTTGASGVAHRGERTWRILEDDVPFARVSPRPSGERIGHALFPFRSAAGRMSVIWILRIGETVKRPNRHGRPGAWS